MQYLWTFYDYPETSLPNTNNALEAVNTDLKTKLRVHNGLSKRNRMVVVDEYFWQKVQLKKKSPKQPNYTYNRVTRCGWLNDNSGIVWVVYAITENGVNQACYALNISRHLSSCYENPRGSQRVDNVDYLNGKDRDRLCESSSQVLMCVSSYCIVFVQSKKTHESSILNWNIQE